MTRPFFLEVDYKNLVGLGFDGAAAMSGHLSGAQSLFQADLPHAYYVHCFAHHLNLVLLHSTKVRKPLAEIKKSSIV